MVKLLEKAVCPVAADGDGRRHRRHREAQVAWALVSAAVVPSTATVAPTKARSSTALIFDRDQVAELLVI
jgi:hypothetical protein